jgi:hypothetical protein
MRPSAILIKHAGEYSPNYILILTGMNALIPHRNGYRFKFLSDFCPTPHYKSQYFGRKDTQNHEKATPVDRCEKSSQATDIVDFKGEILEARVGIEPTHKGFADLSLTTWVPRLGRAVLNILFSSFHSCRSQSGWRRRAEWSGRRDLNSRPSPWQGDALPLSYSRLLQI